MGKTIERIIRDCPRCLDKEKFVYVKKIPIPFTRLAVYRCMRCDEYIMLDASNIAKKERRVK